MVDKADLKSSAQFGRAGSSPARGTNIPGPIAQLARAPALQAGGRGFESH